MSMIHRALKEVEGQPLRAATPVVTRSSTGDAGARFRTRSLIGLAAVGVLGAASPLVAIRMLPDESAESSPQAQTATERRVSSKAGVTESILPHVMAAAPEQDTAQATVAAADGSGVADSGGDGTSSKQGESVGAGESDAHRKEGSSSAVSQDPDREATPADGEIAPAPDSQIPKPEADSAKGAKQNDRDKAVADVGAQQTHAPPDDTLEAGSVAQAEEAGEGHGNVRMAESTEETTGQKPTQEGAIVELARALHGRMTRAAAAGDWAAAEAAMAELEERLPDSHLLRLRMRGWYAFKRQRYGRARAFYQRVLERSPGDVGASVNLASVHLRQGHPERARAVIERARRHARGAPALERAARRLGLQP